jgi:type IV secretion system protein VirB4
MLGILLFSSGLSILLVPALRKIFFPKFKISILADTLPFSFLSGDKRSIVTKNGTRAFLLEVFGVDLSIKTKDELTSLLSRRKEWLNVLAKDGIHLKIFTLREEVKMELPANYDNKILSEVHDKWMKNFTKIYQNKHYILFSMQENKGGLKQFFSNLSQKPKTLSIIEDAIQKTKELLPDYGVREVTANIDGSCPLLEFWSKIINGKKSEVKGCEDNLDKYLSFAAIEFDSNNGIITYIDGQERTYAAIVSLNIWGKLACSNMLKDILELKTPLVVLHQMQGINQLLAKAAINYKYNQATMLGASQELRQEYELAIEGVSSGNVSLYKYQLSFIVQSNSKAELKQHVSQIRAILSYYGISPIQETSGIEYVWCRQLPDSDILLRPTEVFSNNLSSLIAFESEARGLNKSDWGDGSLRYFQTSSGGAYAFQLHVSEEKEALAHSVVVAKAGSGKTTLFSFLIGGALRHKDLRAFFFDRLNGARIYTQSTGGTYVDLSQELPINPLVCNDSSVTRKFLANFFKQISGAYDNDSSEVIANAIDIIFTLPQEMRILTDIFEECFAPKSLVYSGLLKWTGDRPQAKWFNGHKKIGNKKFSLDALSLDSSRLVAFEMTDILDDDLVCAPMVSYILYRIRDLVRQQALPHLIFIDETKKMLIDPVFRAGLHTLLDEQRKLRGSVNLCFHNPRDLIDSGMEKTILTQCQTILLFQDQSALPDDYAIFNLSASEFEFIKGESRAAKTLKNSVLLKKGSESVILNVDLRPLGEHLQIYRSGSEPVKIVKELQQKWGQTDWVSHYLDLKHA